MAASELPVVFIMGPTASGKTGVAMELVQKTDADIVSVDSAMIYKGMDIGTAKPTPVELIQAPHALIDVLDPAESWSVGEFCHAAKQQIELSHQQGRIPLLTGGTMMYFRALEHGLNQLPQGDAEVRQQIDTQAQETGWPAVHAELCTYDSTSAAKIHPNDSQRIQRAVEVFRITGQPLSALQAQTAEPLGYPLIKVALKIEDRAQLHQRIQTRFEQMMKDGFLNEVEGLFRRGDLNRELPSIRSVGYRQLWSFLNGEVTLAEAQEKAKTATRQLAKRQMTWLRSDKDLVELPTDGVDTVSTVLNLINKAHA